MKVVLETLAGIVGGLVGWFVVGMAAGQVLSAIHGNREGAASMGGFFVIGPVGGIVGFVAAFWLVRRHLEPAAVTGPGTFLWPLAALAAAVGIAWAAISILAAVNRPETPADLDRGEKARIEFRVQVPNVLLHGRPVGDAMTLAYRVNDLYAHDTVTPVTWNASDDGSVTTLTGSIPIEERFHERYLLLTQGSQEYSIYVEIPPNMHRAGQWQDTLYLGRDSETPMAERVSMTCRYQPPGR